MRAAVLTVETALDDEAVDRDALAGLDHDDAAHGHLVRVHLLQFSVHLDVRIVRADIHQRGDAAPALAHGDVLEQLADLIEEHDGHRLVEVAAALVDGKADGAQRRHRHEEVLVKDLPVADAQGGLAQDVPADGDIGRGIQHQLCPHRQRQDIDQDQQHRRDGDAPEHLFLFSVHGGFLLFLFDKNAPLSQRGVGIRRRFRSRAPPCGRPSAHPA